MRNKLLRTLALIFIICVSAVCLSVVGCDGCGNKDKIYYLYENGEYEQNDYINIVSGDKFTSTAYGEGTYVTAEGTYTFMTAEGKFIVSGTLLNDSINLSDGKVYRLKGETDDKGNKWTNEAVLKGFAGCAIDQEHKLVMCDLPKGTTTFDFANNVSVSLTATWKLYDNQGAIIKSKIIDNLANGDNVFKIIIKSGDWSIQAVTYTVTIHVIYEVNIEYYSQGELYYQEVVDTHSVLGAGPSITNITGYKFGGWGSLGYYVTGPKKFNAVWNGVTYHVAYDGNGADAGVMTPSTHTYGTGSKLNKNTFSRTGYYFEGWSESAEGTRQYVDEATVKTLCSIEEGTKTLFAFWSSAKYSIRYNKNAENATGTMGNTSCSYGISKALATNEFTNKGYHFTGWATTPTGEVAYTDSQEVINLSSEDGAIVDLYAVWEINTYTVKFDGNGADSGEVADQTFTYGETHTAPISNYTRTGYIYQGGWSTTPTGEVEFAEGVVMADVSLDNDVIVTLYAVWKPITYTVVFNKNGGSGSMDSMQIKYDEEKALTANAFTNIGMKFAGWGTSSTSATMSYADSEVVKNLASVDGATVNLYAMWSANVYYVAYSKNSTQATGTMEKSTYHYGISQALKANEFERVGYKFVGWATEATGEVVYADKQVVSNLCAIEEGTVTIFAKWQPIQYTIAYNGSGATAGSMSTSTYNYDENKALTTNSFVRTGYTFRGWAIEEDGALKYTDGQTVKNLTTTDNDTIQLYALWQANQYKVTYNGNNSTGGSTTQTNHIYDVPSTLAMNGFTKTGYRFSCWKTVGGMTYSEGAEVTNLTAVKDGEVELTAVWIKNVTTITVTNVSETVAPKLNFTIRYAFGTDEVAINKVQFVLVDAPEGTTLNETTGVLKVTELNGCQVKVKIILTEPYGTIESSVYTFNVAKGISDATALANIINDLDGDYAIVNDIAIDGSSWTPIGTAQNPFTGKIVTSGNYVITVYITTTQVAIFGACSDDAVVDIAVRYKKNS